MIHGCCPNNTSEVNPKIPFLDIFTYRIINRAEVLFSGRQSHKVQVRSLVCLWASMELVMSVVQLSKRLKIFQPTVYQFATRGEKKQIEIIAK